jgi:hypothetical protein
LVKAFGPVITSVVPSIADVPSGGLDVVINGANLFNASVTFGSQSIAVTAAAADGTSLTIHVPPSSAPPPTCPTGILPGTEVNVGTPVNITVTNRATTCAATFTGAFQYTLPCI